MSGSKTQVALLVFLKQEFESSKLKLFRRDDWLQMIDFILQYENSLKNYNENESWPTLYDNFIEWVRKDENGYSNLTK